MRIIRLAHGSWLMAHGILYFLTCALCLAPCTFVYSQQDNLEVKGKIQAQSLTIRGGDTVPATPVKGEVFYRSDQDQYYTFDGASWQEMRNRDWVVATKVVAAYNSDTPDGLSSCRGDGSVCVNTKADFTCDGTDDQLKIQQAIDALGANPGVVYLLEGTYNISGSINLDSVTPPDPANPDDSGKAIIGAGKGTILTAMSAVNVINASNVNRILISQLMINGNNKIGLNGINFSAVTDSRIEKVWVEYMKNDGILFGSSTNNIISANHIQSNGGRGIFLDSSSTNNIISANHIQSNGGRGIFLDSSSNNNTISGNNIRTNTGVGVYIESSTNNMISANNIQSNLSGIYFNYADQNNISSNSISLNTNSGIAFNTSSNNTISANNFQSNSNHIYMQSASSSEVSNNNIIVGNVLKDAAGAHIYLPGKCSNNLIALNRLSGTAGTSGIHISDPGLTTVSENNYIVGNMITTQNPADRILDYGTSTAYTDKTKLTFEPVAGYTGLTDGGTLTPNGPASYIRLNPTQDITLGNPAIAIGKSPGDLLILENTTSFMVRFIENPNNLRLVTQPLELYQNEVLTLIWDGTSADCCWVQTGGKGS